MVQLHLVHEIQFLGCFREGLDTASRDLLRDVRNNFEECASYCIRQDALVFGMTVNLLIKIIWLLNDSKEMKWQLCKTLVNSCGHITISVLISISEFLSIVF